jgi:hypothetical protein
MAVASTARLTLPRLPITAPREGGDAPAAAAAAAESNVDGIGCSSAVDEGQTC